MDTLDNLQSTQSAVFGSFLAGESTSNDFVSVTQANGSLCCNVKLLHMYQ